MPIDAADLGTWPAGYSPVKACPFPDPHGALVQTNLPIQSGFQHVCHTHLDEALLTIAAPTPVGGQGQPRCSGCDAGPAIPGANPYGIVAAHPALQTFTTSETPQVRACEQHAVRALAALLAAS